MPNTIFQAFQIMGYAVLACRHPKQKVCSSATSNLIACISTWQVHPKLENSHAGQTWPRRKDSRATVHAVDTEKGSSQEAGTNCTQSLMPLNSGSQHPQIMPVHAQHKNIPINDPLALCRQTNALSLHLGCPRTQRDAQETRVVAAARQRGNTSNIKGVAYLGVPDASGAGGFGSHTPPKMSKA